ncbi:hypothetical protein GCM10010306_090240 [Streptomyces umbrinus]|nr:hypothetical protein GCM10010306_090240 [Streptomyces umbrinus]
MPGACDVLSAEEETRAPPSTLTCLHATEPVDDNAGMEQEDTIDGPLGDRWSALAREILRGETAAADASCPHCGAQAVTCREVGQPESPTGYAEAQCEECGHGIFVVRVPGVEGYPPPSSHRSPDRTEGQRRRRASGDG